MTTLFQRILFLSFNPDFVQYFSFVLLPGLQILHFRLEIFFQEDERYLKKDDEKLEFRKVLRDDFSNSPDFTSPCLSPSPHILIPYMEYFKLQSTQGFILKRTRTPLLWNCENERERERRRVILFLIWFFWCRTSHIIYFVRIYLFPMFDISYS